MAIPRIRGRALQILRKQLFKDFPWCVLCLEDGRRTKATIRDHVIPLSEGGDDDESNVQAVCLDCFDAKKKDELARGLVPSGLTDRFRRGAAPRDAAGQFSIRRTTPAGRRRQHPDQPPDVGDL